MLYETHLIIAFSEIGRCSQVSTSHWEQRKCATINLSLAASGMILHYSVGRKTSVMLLGWTWSSNSEKLTVNSWGIVYLHIFL